MITQRRPPAHQAVVTADVYTRVVKSIERVKPDDKISVLVKLAHIVCSALEEDSAYQRFISASHQSFISDDKKLEKYKNEVPVAEMFKDTLALFDKYIKPLLNINPDWQKYIPWLAQQISANPELQIEKLLPYVVETQEDIKDGKPTLWALIRSKNVDVNKLNLPDLVKEISGWTKRTVSQGEIVYQFKSGWTLQKLVSKKQLEDEGKALEHCVGGYWAKVREGECEIYSIRDSNNEPRATIEWLLIGNNNEDYYPHVAQVYGPHNSKVHTLDSNTKQAAQEAISVYFNDDLYGTDLVGLPYTSEQEKRFAGTPSGRKKLASRTTSLKFMQQLASDTNASVRRNLAMNPSIPSEVAVKLASDADKQVRMNLARNPSIPSEVAVKLASDADKQVRLNLARNPSIPSEVAVKLASDANASVRWVLSENPSIPSEVAVKLASDADEQVRLNLSENPSIPSEVAVKLASDAKASVRRNLARNESIHRYRDVVIKLASDPNSDVRFYLASNTAIHRYRDVVIKLASDADVYVRDSLSANPSQAVQEILKEIEQRTVSRYLPSLLEAVARRIRR